MEIMAEGGIEAAKINGRKAIIYVPKETTLKRIQAIEKYGAVIQINGHYGSGMKA